jgi:hypothetical protein
MKWLGDPCDEKEWRDLYQFIQERPCTQPTTN